MDIKKDSSQQHQFEKFLPSTEPTILKGRCSCGYILSGLGKIEEERKKDLYLAWTRHVWVEKDWDSHLENNRRTLLSQPAPEYRESSSQYPMSTGIIKTLLAFLDLN